MEFIDSYELYKQIDRLLNEGHPEEALSILESGIPRLSEEDARKHYCFFTDVKSHVYCGCARFEEAIETLQEMQNRGLTCSPRIIGKLPFAEDARLIKLRQKNDIMLAKMKQEATLQYEVHLPEGYDEDKEYPLFFALHQGGDNLHIFNWYWKPDAFLRKDYIFVYVQSSQLMRSERYEWLGDMERTRVDLKRCYDIICSQYAIKKDQVLVGGFSCGAIAAMEATFADLFPIKGFITVSPSEIPESANPSSIRAAADRGVRGVMVAGQAEQPDIGQQKLLELLRENGLDCPFYINDDVVYYYPEELSKTFEKALQYIEFCIG